MAATETFANNPSTTVSSGGTTAPAGGTPETWTVGSSSLFPAAATGTTQFHVADPAQPGELIAVTNISGTTWTVTRGAESTTPATHAAGFTVYQVVSAAHLTGLQQNRVDWLNVVTGYVADPTGAADSTLLIQNALNAASPGQTVYMPAGIYKTTAPLTVPPGVTLRGAAGNILSLTSYGTVIQPSAAWAQGGAAAAAVILLLNQTDGGYAVTSEEQKIISLMIDASLMTVQADGIQGLGQVNNVLLRDVAIDFQVSGISYVSSVGGNGVTHVGAHAQSPDTWRGERVTVHRAGLSGFVVTAPDSTWIDCNAIGCGQQGTSAPAWSIATCSNSTFIGCRGENTGNTGNGFTYTGSSNTGSGVSFVGCSTNQSGGHGFEITSTSNSGSGPVILSGCHFHNDGFNPFPWLGNSGGTGGGSFAGIFITNGASFITISGCTVVPGGANGGNSPQYGLSVTSDNGTRHSRIMVSGSLLWGAGSPLNNDGSCPALVFDPSCVFGTGTGATPTYYAAGAKLIAASSAVPVPTATENLYGEIAGALAVSVPRWAITTNTIGTSSGQGYFRQLVLPGGLTVTNLAFRVGNQAKTGGTHGWYVLCDKNFKVLAASTDQTDGSTTWGTTNTDQSLAVTTDGSTKYVTTYSGVYYAVFCVVQSSGTQPQFCGAASVTTGIAGQSPLLCGTCAGAANTTPPAVGSTIGTLAGIANNNFYAYVT